MPFQIYYDYIEGGKSSQSENLYAKKGDDEKIALHEKILKEYLAKMKLEKPDSEQSIEWITHQKCQDMFILSKVRDDKSGKPLHHKD